MSDEDLIDGEWEEEYEEDFTAATRSTVIPADAIQSLAGATDVIRSLIVDSFVEEAIQAAIMIRNIKGDGDGFIAEQADLIKDNLKVFCLGVKKDPAELVISLANSIDDLEARKEFVSFTISKLVNFHDALVSQG